METAEQEKEHAKRFFKFLEGGMVEITAFLSCRSNSALPWIYLAPLLLQVKTKEWAEFIP